MRLDPAVRDQDYDISRLIGEVEPGAASEVARSIREAQVGRSVTVMKRLNVNGLGLAAAMPTGQAAPPAVSPVVAFQDADAGWKVFKATQQLSGHVPYVMTIDPVLPRTEYDPIRLIQEVFPSEIATIFPGYRAAFAGQAVMSLGHRLEMRQ